MEGRRLPIGVARAERDRRSMPVCISGAVEWGVSSPLTAFVARRTTRCFSLAEHGNPLDAGLIVCVTQDAADPAQVTVELDVAGTVLLQARTTAARLNAHAALQAIHILGVRAEKLAL